MEIICAICGKVVKDAHGRQKYCRECMTAKYGAYYEKHLERWNERRKVGERIGTCADCGVQFQAPPKGAVPKYCPACKKRRMKEYQSKRFQEKKAARPPKYCECGVEIPYTRDFCEKCSAKRRKEKMKEYGQSRDQEKQKAYDREYKRMVFRKLREERKAQGLCTECGAPAAPGRTKCEKCHEQHRAISIRHLRKKGAVPAGDSKWQLTVFRWVKKALPGMKVTYNDWSVIKNPETGHSMELDVYVPDLKIAFEIDGPMHREAVYGKDRLAYQTKNDEIKDKVCHNLGITLIRINTDMLEADIYKVKDFVGTTLSQATEIAK